MTKIKFMGATAIASNHEALTVGAVGLGVQFEFNSAWDGLHKTAVFHCGGVTKDVLDSSFPANICPIPWECLQEEGETLYCGVYGTDSNGKVIIPSKMARLGTVHPGADPTGDESLDPTLPVWQQALNIAQDAMSKLAGKVNRSGDTMQGDLDMGFHTLRLGSTTGMTEDNLNIIRLVAYREEDGVTLRNIDTPYEDSDAVNKKYVDDKVNALNTDDIHISAESEFHAATDTVTEVLDGLSKAIINIPKALPNPHKLTINGTEYDGSADVQMTIEGGGSSYDDTELRQRIGDIEAKESTWDAKLNASELPTAINTALAQAKASGEFDGADGYTPVRGTDYWTPDDIATIQSYIDEKAAALQSKSITDSGGHFTSNTVEGALQEIGAELAGINTLLGSGIQISFTIEDATCTANAGETFYEWIGSGYKYLDNGMVLSVGGSDDGVIFLDEAGVYALSLDGNTPVHGGDKIISGGTYTSMHYGG